MKIRSATTVDLNHVVRIQAVAYVSDFHEPAEALLAKLMLSDGSSFIVEVNNEVIAYAIAFPWRSEESVVLHSIDLAMSNEPSCMYIHDVAVNPEHRGSHVATELVNVIMQRSEELSLHQCELVAVQNSQMFWERHGFQPNGSAGHEYGDGAVKMVRSL
jgi:N-acetylglutamate synthase-like GNAT family acetyltransferase